MRTRTDFPYPLLVDRPKQFCTVTSLYYYPTNTHYIIYLLYPVLENLVSVFQISTWLEYINIQNCTLLQSCRVFPIFVLLETLISFQTSWSDRIPGCLSLQEQRKIHSKVQTGVIKHNFPYTVLYTLCSQFDHVYISLMLFIVMINLYTSKAKLVEFILLMHIENQ